MQRRTAAVLRRRLEQPHRRWSGMLAPLVPHDEVTPAGRHLPRIMGGINRLL